MTHKVRLSVIQFQNIHKTYLVKGQAITALHPCQLSIPRGQIYGLIGHSGAGKSTLLRLINRLETPSGGQLWVDGVEVTQLDAAGLRQFRQGVGMIFQHFNLLSSKTVADNIAMPLRLAGLHSAKEIDAKVAQLLRRVGLEDHAKKYPAQLSGGQKQRVGIARALSTDPKILLCDEATSALDPETTQQVLDLLLEINQELKLTLVLITHEMEVVRKVADRVAVMDQGHIVEEGPVAEVFLHPQHPTTRRFVYEAEQLDEQALIEDFSKVEGQVYRLTFQGEATYRPLLAQIAKETQADFTLLSGRIDRIKSTPYGQLLVAFHGGNAQQVLEKLQQADVTLEAMN